MSGLTEADRYLLEQIRQGDAEAWGQLVSRFQGRLVAFARSKTRQPADAEDLVQETFMGFCKGLADYRAEASLETYLFTILRRKIINWLRGRRSTVCSLQDLVRDDRDRSEDGPDPGGQVAAPDPTASWYARRNEERDRQHDALAATLRDLIDGYKKSHNFRDLQVVELLFYCQLRNKEVADVVSLDEKHVGLIKHRCLKRIQAGVQQALRAGAPGPDSFTGSGTDLTDPADSTLTEIWQSLRLSCPKRSTVGAYLLGTLDGPWQEYVSFHLERLGCQFCRANLEDLQRKTSHDASHTLRDRIMESTVGFLSAP